MPDVIDRSSSDLTHVSVVSDYFPCVDLASREHGMHQLAQGRLLSRSQHRSPCRHGFERLNKPVERPLRVFEAINQDRALTVGCCSAAWLQSWLQSRRRGADLRPSANEDVG